MKKISFFLLVIFFLASCRTSQKLSSKNIPIRGTWLTNVVSDALDSPKKLKEAVKYCHDLGLNTVFVVVWNRGRTLYRSQTMKNLIGIEVDQKYFVALTWQLVLL